MEFRYKYTIDINTGSDYNCIIMLHPSSIDGNDNTIKSFKNGRFNNFLNNTNKLDIFNLFPFVTNNLNLVNNMKSHELFLNQDLNYLIIINNILDNNYKKIIFSCGQHFMSFDFRTHKNIALNEYNRLKDILSNYSDRVYCYGYTITNYPICLTIRNIYNNNLNISNKLILFYYK